MRRTNAQLLSTAQSIIDESRAGGNTKSRVGGLLQDIVDSLGSLGGDTYSTILTFNNDKEVYANVIGQAVTFTLASSGNVNGIGIIVRLNKPSSVSFPGNFEAAASSEAFDNTKMNVCTLVYFSNWDGVGTARIIYSNKTFNSV
jgi:hypothetical protein